MKYENIEKGVFIARPNRFIAVVKTQRGEEIAHVKNTGRCREFLLPGAQVILCRFPDDAKRSTKLDLISVYRGERLINIDSSAPNKVVAEWLKDAVIDGELPHDIKSECSVGDSRFDFSFMLNKKRAYMEVKGVTLFEGDGACRAFPGNTFTKAFFPDAPTKRGQKHVNHLMKLALEGNICYILFLVQSRGIGSFSPNRITDFQFSEALDSAVKNGVRVLAFDSVVTENEIILNEPVNVIL